MQKVRRKITGKKYVIVDESDAHLLESFHWRARASRNNKFYVQKHPSKNCSYVYLHRLIMAAPRDKVVDHINGNPLDNRRSNLRLCSLGENIRNKALNSNSTTGYKGVTFDKSRKKFAAQIEKEGRHYHLGRFKTAKEAATAYDIAALLMFGEFAKPNFPRSNYA